MPAEKKKKDDRVRVWTFDFYPGDSAPENWLEILKEYHIGMIISPLHDKDVFEKDDPERGIKKGDPKKPHRHAELVFDGKKSYEQVLPIAESVHGTIPIRVDSIRGYTRYLIHLDDPDKAQYRFEDIIIYGGIDVKDYFTDSVSRIDMIHDMQVYISDNNIFEFCDFLDRAYDFHKDWFRACCEDSAYIINQYIKSCRNKFLHPVGMAVLEDSEYAPEVEAKIIEEKKNE